MAKKYDLSSKSDMRQFTKDLESAIMEQAQSALLNEKYEVTCPHCQAHIEVKPGHNICPHCREDINLRLEFN